VKFTKAWGNRPRLPLSYLGYTAFPPGLPGPSEGRSPLVTDLSPGSESSDTLRRQNLAKESSLHVDSDYGERRILHCMMAEWAKWHRHTRAGRAYTQKCLYALAVKGDNILHLLITIFWLPLLVQLMTCLCPATN